jgi:hypothetical protein
MSSVAMENIVELSVSVALSRTWLAGAKKIPMSASCAPATKSNICLISQKLYAAYNACMLPATEAVCCLPLKQ